MDAARMRADLLRKGWTIEEIEAAVAILQTAPQSKSRFVKILDKVVFWINLLLALTGNFIISVVLIPFMLFADRLYLYPALFIIGLSFGALYDMVVFDIERIEEAPKIFVGPFLLAIALINIYIITTLSNLLANEVGLTSSLHLPLAVAVIYTAGFMAPYTWTRWESIKRMATERKSYHAVQGPPKVVPSQLKTIPPR